MRPRLRLRRGARPRRSHRAPSHQMGATRLARPTAKQPLGATHRIPGPVAEARAGLSKTLSATIIACTCHCNFLQHLRIHDSISRRDTRAAAHHASSRYQSVEPSGNQAETCSTMLHKSRVLGSRARLSNLVPPRQPARCTRVRVSSERLLMPLRLRDDLKVFRFRLIALARADGLFGRLHHHRCSQWCARRRWQRARR